MRGVKGTERHFEQDIELDIEDITELGDGVGRHEGMAVFVTGAVPGDRVTARILQRKKRFARAELMTILKASPDRVVPKCPIFHQCGGCTLQHMRYAAQCEVKTQMVDNALRRIGGIAEARVQPLLAMETPYRYRNKGTYAVRWMQGRAEIGFYASRSHELVPVRDCLLMDVRHAELLAAIRSFLERHGDEGYAEGLSQVVMRTSGAQGALMVIFVFRGALPKGMAALAEAVWIPTLSVCSVYATEEGATQRPEYRLLKGQAGLEERLGGLVFSVSPAAFFQVNVFQTERLYAEALKCAALTGAESVVELYCGTGTLSLMMAQRAKQVTGIEIVPEAVANARASAAANGILNAMFICEDAARAIAAMRSDGKRADVVVLDPPRAGCDPVVMAAVAEMAPARIVYISCKPSTLARDLRLLLDMGYAVTSVQPVEMFAQTGHVETVVLMSRVEARESENGLI